VHGIVEPGVYSEPGQPREPRRAAFELAPIQHEGRGIYALEMHGTSLEGVEPRAPNGSMLICVDLALIGGKIEPHKLYIVECKGKEGLVELSARRARTFDDHVEFHCDDSRHPPISVPLPIEAHPTVKVRAAVWRVIREVGDYRYLIKR
jgi:hypothetical protein